MKRKAKIINNLWDNPTHYYLVGGLYHFFYTTSHNVTYATLK